MLATCRLKSGALGQASVPSGASVGAAEAVDRRDGDRKRYGGLGCREAVANIQGELNEALSGATLEAQAELDQRLVALDGTSDKSRIGANAILAVSLAWARAVALESSVPLWRYFATLAGLAPTKLPRLTINLFSGGKHAGQQVPVQDVLIVPVRQASIDGGLAMAWDIYQAAADLSLRRYGMRLLRADEGGMAPPFQTPEEMLDMAVESIKAAGYEPGEEVALAIDVASTHFYQDGKYDVGRELLSSSAMIDRLRQWVETYPLVSVEDGLSEEDWENWPSLSAAIGARALVLGDDLLCTQVSRIRRAIDTRACNALLLKVNQVGTLTEACEALQLARGAGWSVTVSVRSGETEDDWAADLAVGWCGDQFKNGSITQSERLAKYNRVLEIEQQTGFSVVEWPSSILRNHGLG